MDLLDFTADTFGIPSVLVNAAGGNDASVTVTPENPFSEIAVEDWVANFDLNLIGGALLPCQVIGAAMVEAGRGVSSISPAFLPTCRFLAWWPIPRPRPPFLISLNFSRGNGRRVE